MSPIPEAPLRSYRSLVALDEPFPKAAPADPAQVPAIIDRVVRALLAERRDASGAAEGDSTAGPGERELLKALLTMREAEPLLAPELHADLDRLLQYELALRGTTEAMALPSVAQVYPGSPWESAPACSLWHGDITALRVDAIVNAAN